MPSKRALACLVGTITGLAVAFYSPLVIWWIGALLGAVTTGILFSWQEILHHAPTAARSAQTGMKALPWLWQRRLKTAAWTLLGITIIVTFAVIYTPYNLIMLVFLVQLPVILIMFTRAAIVPNGSVMIYGLSPREVRKRERIALVAASPGPGTIFLISIALFFAIKGLWWTLLHMPMFIVELVTFTPRFLVILYRLTNTHERVVVILDALIVISLTYLYVVRTSGWELGPTLVVGGIAGGLLGHFHYQVASRFVTPLFSR